MAIKIHAAHHREPYHSEADIQRARRRTTVLDMGGGRRIVTHGLHEHFWSDLYHYAMTINWPLFFVSVASLFVVLNLVFACIYSAGTAAIANQSPAGFAGAFFFSVETLATVGYGDMHPANLYGHITATVEIFLGMSFIALFTGIMFARFSRPRARILFARNPVVLPFEGSATLMIRAANARQNVIVDASARLRLLREEVTAEGHRMRKLHDLELVRDQHPIFSLGWSIMHVIDHNSPLFGADAESLSRAQAALILTIDGIDETTSQLMQSRCNYASTAIRWQEAYRDLLWTDEAGVDHMDYTLFDETYAVGEAEEQA